MSQAETLPLRRRVRQRLAWIILGLVTVSATLLAFYEDLLAFSFVDVCNLGTAVAALCIAASVRVAPHGHLSASSVYLIVFSLFHFGLTTPLGIGVEPSDRIEHAIRSWIHRPETIEAVVLASLAASSCVLGSSLVLFFRRNTPETREPTTSPSSHHLALLGAALLTFWVVAWFAVIINVGGWKALVGSYGDLLELTSETPLHWVYLGIGLGLSLVAAGPRGTARRLGFGMFGLFAVVAFPLGLRGEVLFPLSAALVVAARRGIRISGYLSLVLVAAVLAFSAAAKDVRQIGLERFDESELSLDPFDGLMELGSSLRPVVEVITWQHSGDDRLGGASYWAPVERALSLVLPGASRRAARDDERLMNVVVLERVGPIGFSPVAEAHYNFGRWGVIFVLLVTGGILGAMDAWPARTTYLCLTGAVLVPLLNNVRNAFTPVPAQLFVGLSLTALLVFVIGPQRSGRRAPTPAGRYGGDPLRGSPRNQQ